MSVDTSGIGLGDRVALLKAVADTTRLQILDVLATVGPRCHCELEVELSVPANRLSFHLRILREAGLVTTRRRGKLVEYRFTPAATTMLRDAIPASAEVRS